MHFMRARRVEQQHVIITSYPGTERDILHFAAVQTCGQKWFEILKFTNSRNLSAEQLKWHLGGGDLLVSRVLHIGHGLEVIARGEPSVALARFEIHGRYRHDHVNKVLSGHLGQHLFTRHAGNQTSA